MVAITPKWVEQADGTLTADLMETGRLGLVKRYLEGDHDKPYMPKSATREYKHIAENSVSNWLPLISQTFAKGLFVDGFRTARANDNAKQWSYWQANGMDARQSVIHRSVLEYGTAYVLVLPGTYKGQPTPVMRAISPLKMQTWYRDDDDEFPEVALNRVGTSADGTRLVEVYDDTNIYYYSLADETGAGWVLDETVEHGMGVCPVIRFRERLDAPALGIIAPLIPLQNRINEITFNEQIALAYAAFRQRWAVGLTMPEDDEGNPIQPFQAAVDRLWVAEDSEVKFGDFAQSDTSGHRQAYNSAVSTLAAVAQIHPALLTGSFDNVSADALAALQDSTQRKIAEYQTLFGEFWESCFRLAAVAAGDAPGSVDTAAEVRWRDTETRTFAATVDGLGKLAQMLNVPVKGLWELIPGVTDGDIARWNALAETDPITALASSLQQQGVTATNTLNAATAPNANADQPPATQ